MMSIPSAKLLRSVRPYCGRANATTNIASARARNTHGRLNHSKGLAGRAPDTSGVWLWRITEAMRHRRKKAIETAMITTASSNNAHGAARRK